MSVCVSQREFGTDVGGFVVHAPGPNRSPKIAYTETREEADRIAEGVRCLLREVERQRDEARTAAGRLLFRYTPGCEGDPWRDEYDWLADAADGARRDWYRRNGGADI